MELTLKVNSIILIQLFSNFFSFLFLDRFIEKKKVRRLKIFRIYFHIINYKMYLELEIIFLIQF